MAWERPFRKRYYTRSGWHKGQVRREYIGGGKAGMLAAVLDELIQGERQRLLKAYQELRARSKRLRYLAYQHGQLVELVTGAALWAEGLGVAVRYLWRHRPYLRCLDADSVDLGLVEQVRDLVRRAQQGRREVVAVLRELLAGPVVWEAVAKLGERVRGLCRGLLAGDGQLARSFDDEARKLARRLAGPRPSPLVGLFAQRASLIWLEARSCGEALSRLRDLTAYPPRFLTKHLEQASQQYHAAVRGLQQLENLLEPDELASDWTPESQGLTLSSIGEGQRSLVLRRTGSPLRPAWPRSAS